MAVYVSQYSLCVVIILVLVSRSKKFNYDCLRGIKLDNKDIVQVYTDTLLMVSRVYWMHVFCKHKPSINGYESMAQTSF